MRGDWLVGNRTDKRDKIRQGGSVDMQVYTGWWKSWRDAMADERVIQCKRRENNNG